MIDLLFEDYVLGTSYLGDSHLFSEASHVHTCTSLLKLKFLASAFEASVSTLLTPLLPMFCCCHPVQLIKETLSDLKPYGVSDLPKAVEHAFRLLRDVSQVVKTKKKKLFMNFVHRDVFNYHFQEN